MKEVEKIIDKISKVLKEKLEPKGLVSLYLSGTILTKDRTKMSDIDFFGFVEKRFDIKKEEEKINKFLDKNRKKLCGSFECRFRAIGLNEISGKIKRGNMSNYMGVRSLSIHFKFWKLMWGKKINFSIKPYSLNHRKKLTIKKLKFMIKEIENGKGYFMQGISKEIIRLAEIESEIKQKKKYTYFYTETQKRFKDKNHIVHEAMRLRNKKVTKKEILKIIPKIKDYIKEF
jgi:hypothetical protein